MMEKEHYYEFSIRQVKEIVKRLREGKRSEDPDSYRDSEEDYQWGPALGAAAQNAKEDNLKLEKFIIGLKRNVRNRNIQLTKEEIKSIIDEILNKEINMDGPVFPLETLALFIVEAMNGRGKAWYSRYKKRNK